MAKKQQNCYLNYWKGIACFGVVFVHTRFPAYILDGMLQTIFRFSVPLFFMISGYYSYGEDRKLIEKKLHGKTKRIFWINLGGCFYYFVVQMAIALLGDSHGSMKDVIERLHMMFNRRAIIDWIVFNQDPFINIMWFTSALWYCYLVFWVINHFNLYRVFYTLIPVFLTIHLVLGNFLTLLGMEIPKVYYRNFLLFGLPFFMLGNWVHKHQNDILEKLTQQRCHRVLIVGILLGIMEWFLVGRREMYIGTLGTVISIYLLALHQPEKEKNSFITQIGMHYSLFVYIVHYSLVIVMERFANRLIVPESKIYYIYMFVRPFLVFGLCVAGAYVFYRILEILRTRNISKENKIDG